MKILALLVCLGFLLAGCTTEQVTETQTQYKVEPNIVPLDGTAPSAIAIPPATTPTYTVPGAAIPTNLPPADVPVVAAPSTPTWATDTIRETGKCAVDVNFKGSPVQAQVMAERGADLIARRNLLERIAGLRIDSRTTVKDMVAEEDLVNASSSGLLRGARTVDRQFDGGTATSIVEISLAEVYQYVTTRQ